MMNDVNALHSAQGKVDNSNRNYQIDVLKMFLIILVFVSHFVFFLPSETSDSIIAKYNALGWVSVQMFFLISGFLMVKSLLKKNYDKEHAGKNAISFVIGKFKPIALPFWISNAMIAFMQIVLYTYIYISTGLNTQNKLLESFKSPVYFITNLISEAFCITNVGEMRFASNNSITWYISVMLFAMIPLSYFLITKKESFIYIFSPVASILLWGFLKSVTPVFIFPKGEPSEWINLLRTVCGLCFGIVAWTIYNKLISLKNCKFVCTCFTVIEVLSYLAFFLLLIFKGDEASLMFPAFWLMPIAVAISFSGKSYLSKLFKSKIFKHFGTASLYIYLNHFAALNIVMVLCAGKSYWFCAICGAVLTAVLCVVCYIGVRIVRFIIKKVKQHIEQEKVENV